MNKRSEKLFQQISSLKLMSKQLIRQSNKCEREEKLEINKVKLAIEKSNMAGAHIHAQSAIRNKNTQLNFLRFSARIDGVVDKLQAQMKLGEITSSMSAIVKTLTKTGNAQNLSNVSEVMDAFERQCENLDVQAEYVTNAMASTTATATPEEDVASLVQQVADAHGLALEESMPFLQSSNVCQVAAPATDLDDSVLERLEALRK